MRRWVFRHPIWLAVGLAVVVLAGSLVSWGVTYHVEETSQITGGELRLVVGYDREKTVGQYLVNVCRVEIDGTPVPMPECGEDGETLELASDDPDDEPTTVPGRPVVYSASLSRDPATLDGTKVFPAASVELTAQNEGQDGLKVTATADPSTLAELDDGVYYSTVVVQRSEGSYIPVTLAIGVNDRSRLWIPAMWWLVFGGFAGLFLRWFTDTGAPLSKGYRRLRRLRRLLPRRRRVLLSEDVEDAFRDADESLEHHDVPALDALVARLESDCPSLQRCSRVLARASETHEHLVAAALSANDPVGSARNRLAFALEALVNQERNRTWPWTDTSAKQQLVANMGNLEKHIARIDTLLDGAISGDRASTDQLVLIAAAVAHTGQAVLYQDDLGEAAIPATQAMSLVANEQVEPTSRVEAPGTDGAATEPPARTPEIEDADDYYRSLANLVPWVLGFGLLVVTVVAGYLTQVLSSTTYEAQFGDNLSLFIWAFAGVVTGGTIATMLEKVGTSKVGAPAGGS
ncbi:MAG: hypothetical protein KDB35_03620 [Acidimicrobiales bacterium]|nr:hypothetical protein [Acidimicrobiales bacterium]